MRYQRGWLTKKSGSWLGHFNRRVSDPSTGKIIRQQPAFVIGRMADLTKAQAARKLRERVEYELNIRPDQRTTLAWYIQHRWKPMREGTWRDSTKQTNKELLKVITDRFGATALEELDDVEMQKWLNDLAKKRSGSVVTPADWLFQHPDLLNGNTPEVIETFERADRVIAALNKIMK